MKTTGISLTACSAAALLAAGFWSLALDGAEPKPKSPQAVEQEIQAHNAARLDKGGRVTLQLLGPDVGQDKRNTPDDSADGDVHSRCVVWGVPYAFRIELVDKLPVTEVNFICSDYANEESPKDIELRLGDGTVIKHTLERIVPKDRRDKPRQTIKIGKDLAWVEVKVLSSFPGAPNPETRIGRELHVPGAVEFLQCLHEPDNADVDQPFPIRGVNGQHVCQPPDDIFYKGSILHDQRVTLFCIHGLN